MDPASAAAAKEREGELFIREVWGLTGTAIFFVFLRYYARLKAVGLKGLTADDYLMFPATVVMSIESMAGYEVVAWWKGFANNGISDSDRATLAQQARIDPNGAAAEELRLRIGGSKNHVVGLLMYTTLMWLLKGCWALYYNRLTLGYRLAGYLHRVSASRLSQMHPFPPPLAGVPNPGVNCMPAISPLQTIFVMVMNTVTDFYLMAIPIPMIWKSKLPHKKKLMIILMFSGAILEMMFGILRAVAILKDGDTNPAESGYWSIRESFVSFVLTNLPMVYPLFREYSNNLRGKTGSTTGKSTGKSYQLGSYPVKSKSKYNNNNNGNSDSRDPHVIPNETITFDSKENICVDTAEHPPRGDSVGEDSSLDLPEQEAIQGVLVALTGLAVTQRQGRGGYQPSSSKRPVDPRQQKSSSTQITITTEYTISDGGKNKAQPGSAYAF
ncbi:hypothetical protein PG994_011797 [Apiospora phragmitis]|uniref:Rhodopsin domain-containing protein n=1 Tax=Apiospora phragmitis TaxID=2905665 RepID=A0ABR1TU11_9PEZI